MVDKVVAKILEEEDAEARARAAQEAQTRKYIEDFIGVAPPLTCPHAPTIPTAAAEPPQIFSHTPHPHPSPPHLLTF